jgi:CBS domain-containing protein
MALMIQKRVRHLPVYENEKLQGLISIGDVVKAILDDKEYMIDQLEQYITNRR